MRLHHSFRNAMLIHLGSNLWYEEDNTVGQGAHEEPWEIAGSRTMRCDRAIWREYIDDLRTAGCNTLIIDLADGVRYRSHPEIAVEDAWSVEELTAELDRLNAMGFEVIPKLNLSTTHDAWMKEYSRMVSTEPYYRLCVDLIDEVSEIFQPELFHIGMDEEGYPCQHFFNYVVIRQNQLWWHDLRMFVDRVEKNGARACMWSDFARNHPDEFVANCPKSVVQCVWYYCNKVEGDLTEDEKIRLNPVDLFEKHGYDQLPTGSSCYFPENFPLFVGYCKNHISEKHLLGYMQTTWQLFEEKRRAKLWRGIKAMEEGIRNE